MVIGSVRFTVGLDDSLILTSQLPHGLSFPPRTRDRAFPSALLSGSPWSRRCRRERGCPGPPGGDRLQQEQPCALAAPLSPSAAAARGHSPVRDGTGVGGGAGGSSPGCRGHPKTRVRGGVPKRKVLCPPPGPLASSRPQQLPQHQGPPRAGSPPTCVSPSPGYLLRCFNDSFLGAGDN